MARVYSGEAVFLSRIVGPVERWIYRCCRIDQEQEMDWKAYAGGLLIFSLAGFIILYLLQRLQGFLPLNPHGFAAVPPDLAFNTAVSFVTNTNWQAYGGETTMSFLTQMAGLAVQNFAFRGVGNGRACGLHQRHEENPFPDHRKCLGGSDALDRLYPSAPFAGHGALPRFPGGGADPAKPGQGPAPGTDHGRKGQCRIRAGDSPGTCGKPGGHQATGNQWRGLFQRQLVPSAGKSDAAVQFRRDAGHSSHPGGALHHLRQDDGGQETGMGALGRHDDDPHTTAWGSAC